MLELRLRRMIEDASTNETSLRRLFSRFDKDNSGKLSRQEMKRVFNELGVKSTDAEVQELVFGLDRSNDGLCSYEEFIRIAYPSGGNGVGTGTGSSGLGMNKITSSLVTLLSERLKDMIRRASGSERELRALFQKFDTKNTGRLTRAKFQTAFANMGLSAPAKEVQELIDAMDTTGDGMVSYGEFVSIVHGGGDLGNRSSNISNRVHAVLQRLVDDASWTKSSIRRLFLSFDKSNDGFITRSEFRTAFRDLKVRATASEIDELIRAIDTNRDGRISYSEFLDMAYKNKSSTSASSRTSEYGDDRRYERNSGDGRSGSDSGFFGNSVQRDLVDKFKQAMMRANWTRSTLSDLFNKFDQNRDGTITYREFGNIVRRDLNLGESYISSSDVDRLLEAMDRNHDGRVDYKEFADFVLEKNNNKSSTSTFPSTGGAMVGRGNASDACLRYVDKDLRRQLATDMPWGEEAELLRLFERYDPQRRGEIHNTDLEIVIDEMNLRVDTKRFVRGLSKGLNGNDDRGNSSRNSSRNNDTMLSSTTRPMPYRDFVTLMCRGGNSTRATNGSSSGMASTFGSGTGTMYGISSGEIGGMGNMRGMGSMGSGFRALTPQELFQEDIAAATAAARTVHAAADQMAMLRAENGRLRTELSSFNVQFFEEIEDLKFAYLTQTRRCDAMTRQIYARCDNPDDVMKTVEEEAGQEVDLQRHGSQGRRQRWSELEQRRGGERTTMGGGGGGGGRSSYGTQPLSRRGPVPLQNEWEVSDQWLQLVFDMADGTALAELERQCRMYDMTNTGTIAAPELRMAFRGTLSATSGVGMTSVPGMPAAPGSMVLSPSAMVFGELVRRFESHQSRMGGVPGVDYSSLLKAILNRGQRPEFADYLAPNDRRSGGYDSRSGNGQDDAVMSMIREWCRRQGSDERRALEDVFNRIDKNRSGRISKKEFDNILLDMKLEASRDQLDAVMRMYDRDGDGTISWNEFVAAVLDGPRGGGSRNSRGGSGGYGGSGNGGRWSDVLNDELRRRIEDAKWTGESLRKLFHKFDRDGSGKISTREFKEVFRDMGIPSKYADVEELVRKIDRDGDGYINYQEFVNAALPNRGGNSGGRSSRDQYDERNGYDSRGATGRDTRGSDRDRNRYDDDRGARGRDTRGRDRDRNRYDNDRGARGRDTRGRDTRGRDTRGRDTRGQDRGRDRYDDDRGTRGSDTRGRDTRGRDTRGRDRDHNSRSGRNTSSYSIADMLDDKLCDLIRKASWNKESLRKLFEKFDKDQSGKISTKEFKRAFEGLGISAAQYDVDDLVRKIDRDGDGFVNFNEFVAAALRPNTMGNTGSGTGGYRHYAAAVDEKLRKLVRDAKFSEAATRKLFSKFDMNNSGCITVGEFKRGFMEMGIQTSTKEITNLIDRLDRYVFRCHYTDKLYYTLSLNML